MHYSYLEPERRIKWSKKRKSYIGAGGGTKPNFMNVRFIKPFVIPYTVRNLSIRRIIGEDAFNKVKVEVKERCLNNCEVCGRGIKLHGDYLHYIEKYDISEKGIFNFLGFLGVCRECYLYRNRGILDKLLEGGEIGIKEYNSILNDKLVLINSCDSPLFSSEYDINTVTIIRYEGIKYINDCNTEISMLAYSKGVRVINFIDNYAMLPINYYHKFIK